MSSPQSPRHGEDSSSRPTATELVGGGWAPARAPEPTVAGSPVGAPAVGAPPVGVPPVGAPPAGAPAAASRGGDPPAEPAPAGRAQSSRREPPPGEPSRGDASPTTVLPTGGVRRPPQRPPVRPGPARAPGPRSTPVADGRPAPTSRRARLALQRIDPWSVFLYALVSSVFLGVALVVAVAVLYAVLGRLGVLDTVNELYLELTGGDAAATPLFTSGRFIGGAVVLAAVNVVLLTLLAALSALLYNLCASFTGGIEVTLGERE